jgi:hypothetical protein
MQMAQTKILNVKRRASLDTCFFVPLKCLRSFHKKHDIQEGSSDKNAEQG